MRQPGDNATVAAAAADAYCGQLPAFSAIPAVSQWRWQWDQRDELRTPNATCRNMSGAEVFYAYHSPHQYSSNLGTYVDDATSVFMIVDASRAERT